MYQLAVSEQHITQTGIIISLTLGLILGGAKGKFVLSKTARRNRARIENLPEPVKVHQVFATPFYGLIAGMMLLGVLMRTFNAYLGGYIVVAAIYCAIGMALIISSRVYWKRDADTLHEKA